MALQLLADTCEAIAATSSRNEKIRRLAEMLKALPPDDAARATTFLSGRCFPLSDERVLAVGPALIWQAVVTVAGVREEQLQAAYRSQGDLGAAAEQVWPQRPPSSLTLAALERTFHELARARTPEQKLLLLEQWFAQLSPPEAKYAIRMLTGELRIGLRASLVEEAIALAYDADDEQVRQAVFLTGDVGRVAQLAAQRQLGSVGPEPGRPLGFMLASPVDDPEEILARWPAGVWVEDKYDGIRAQAHVTASGARLYSRTLDRLEEFPELEAALAQLPGPCILDGEVVAWEGESPLPFTALQRRLGRKERNLWLATGMETPVRYVVFDLLLVGGRSLLDCPLRQRRAELEKLLHASDSALLQISPFQPVHTVEQLRAAFARALERGNEGIMAKAPEAPYRPGRRGKLWLKWKQPLATLDVVVTAVEYGHGRRRGWLSDYVFAVRDGERLVDIGKAYSGLTDEEIRRLTEEFRAHVVADAGWRLQVEPRVVLEVAFNNIQRSNRHASGFALRFPRIVRLRPDKPVAEIDTLDRVRQLYEQQMRRLRR